MLYKFEKSDVFYNQIKAHPVVSFVIYNQNFYYNNIASASNQSVPVGNIDLYESHLPSHPFITKDGNLSSFRSISTTTYNTDFLYGDVITGSYPLSSSVKSLYFAANQSRSFVDALRNVVNSYIISPHFYYTSSYGDKSIQELRLIDIPSIFVGSSIKKGSVSLKFYLTGTLIGELRDDKLNGELRQALPQDANTGSVAGVVLYNHSCLLLTGAWSIHPAHTENYRIGGGGPWSPRWLDFATTGSSTPGADLTNVASSSFDMSFEGTQYVSTITMFAHAPKGELNYSNNPTFISFSQTSSLTPLTSSKEYKEYNDIQVKNIVKSNFESPTGSFENITYISKIKVFDKHKNVIGIAKIATPIRKRERDEISFKIKIDV